MRRAKHRYSRGRTGFFSRHRRLIVLSAAAVAGVFVAANVVLAVIYNNRTYPGTRIMDVSIGSVPYDSLSGKVSELKLLPDHVTLTKDQQTVKVNVKDLGINKDVHRTVDSAKQQRALLPIANLFTSPQLKAPIGIDGDRFEAKAAELVSVIRADAVAARLEIKGTNVTVVKEKNGYALDQKSFKKVLQDALDRGVATVTAPVQTVRAPNKAADLEAEKASLQTQLQTPISFKYEDKTKQASKADVANWYSPSGTTYALANDKLTAYLSTVASGFGIRMKDTNSIVAAITNALKANKASTITVTAQTAAKTYAYCTGMRGVDASQLTALRNKLKSTYADSRGWSLGGLVEFKEVTSGCDFTVWLSASSQMTSFGGVCDPIWSCRSGDNVVFNYDRWMGASDAWNQFGGSLEDYRSMLINHETGHRLGFGHRQCGGAGQLAPVMQQQSISLGGCKFNPWPVRNELDSFRSALGL
ncbi:MAG TPA: DUF3152 domain-containing protein [Candidatus Saccharimonadales bacterium]|nr:DUF3152 domain-containing protein [Candidatus Saccharimonadales bacterium]